MAKMLFVFLTVAIFVFIGIEVVRTMSNKERWALTKTLGYSIIVAVVTVLLLTLFVMVF